MADTLPKTKELRAMTKTDIAQHIATLRQALWQHRVKAKEGALQQTHLITGMRRQIARALTLLGEVT